MIAAERVAVILLAAGRSMRFGARDKLAEPLAGLPLGLHPARILSARPFAASIVVAPEAGPDYGAYGFTRIDNPDPGAGQAGSIALGVAAALRTGAEAALIALADMPFVTIAHIDALLAAFDPTRPIVASTSGAAAGPPALFGAASFEHLLQLTGDAGARMLLQSAAVIAAPARELADIDTPGDLRRHAP